MCPSGNPSIRSVPGPVYLSALYRRFVRCAYHDDGYNSDGHNGNGAGT